MVSKWLQTLEEYYFNFKSHANMTDMHCSKYWLPHPCFSEHTDYLKHNVDTRN